MGDGTVKDHCLTEHNMAARREAGKCESLSDHITPKEIHKCQHFKDTRRKYKVLIAGNPEVGKTSIRRFMEGKDFSSRTDKSFGVDSTHFELSIEDETFHICLFDTAGIENNTNLIKSNLHGTDCLIMAYAVDRKKTFDDLVSNWLPTIMETQHAKSIKHIQILGMKGDLRRTGSHGWSIDHDFTQFEEKYKIPILLNECSSKTGENVNTFFWGLVEELKRNVPAKHTPSTCYIS